VRASERPTIESLIRLSVRAQRRLQIRSRAPGQGLILEINYLAAAAARAQWAPGSTFAPTSGSVCGHDRRVYIPKRRICRPAARTRSHYGSACAHSPRRVIAGILVAKINTVRGQKAACY
jgi:hypothetical protein